MCVMVAAFICAITPPAEAQDLIEYTYNGQTTSLSKFFKKKGSYKSGISNNDLQFFVEEKDLPPLDLQQDGVEYERGTYVSLVLEGKREFFPVSESDTFWMNHTGIEEEIRRNEYAEKLASQGNLSQDERVKQLQADYKAKMEALQPRLMSGDPKALKEVEALADEMAKRTDAILKGMPVVEFEEWDNFSLVIYEPYETTSGTLQKEYHLADGRLEVLLWTKDEVSIRFSGECFVLNSEHDGAAKANDEKQKGSVNFGDVELEKGHLEGIVRIRLDEFVAR